MTELPTLNSELLFALIKWAETDEHLIGNFLLICLLEPGGLGCAEPA